MGDGGWMFDALLSEPERLYVLWRSGLAGGAEVDPAGEEPRVQDALEQLEVGDVLMVYEYGRGRLVRIKRGQAVPDNVVAGLRKIWRRR